MIRAFRGISFTLSLLAPLLAENNIQNYNEPMDYSKGDVSLQPFNNQTNQETQPSTNYNTQPNSMQTPMPNQNPYSQPTTPIQNNQPNNTQTQTMLNNAKQFTNNALNNTKQTITNATNYVNDKLTPKPNDAPISAFSANSPYANKENSKQTQKSDEVLSDDNSDEDNSLKPMTNFNAIQANFFAKNRSIKDNAHFIHYTIGDTFNIRLRYAMTTTFIFDEPIAQVVLGDDIGFSTKMLGEDKEHLISNILLIKPLQIGVDSNLTIIGKSGKVYSFYMFSTTYTSSKNPALMVYISSKEYFKISLPLRKKSTKKINPLIAPKTKTLKQAIMSLKR